MDGAKRLAELSQKQVRAANEMVEKQAVLAQREMLDILGAISGGGRRGGRRPRQQTPRPRSGQDDQLDWGPEGRPGHGVWTPHRPGGWRLDNDFVYHQYSTSELQLVPGRIHRGLPHQGGASKVR